MYPTDVVKTRQQLGSGKTVGMIQQFKDIIRLEGPANLYRGRLRLVASVTSTLLLSLVWKHEAFSF